MRRAVTRIHRFRLRCSPVAVLACCIFLGACGGPVAEPEEQLRQWVSDGSEAAEGKERRELMSMISPAYADARDNERDDIENMLRLIFFRQSSVKLLTSIEEIRLFGDSAAEIELTVAMAGMSDGAFGFSADAYRFEFELEREDEDWLLISARWAELGEELH